jgi:hypothetical protein
MRREKRLKIKGHRPSTDTLTLETLNKYLLDIFTAKSGYKPSSIQLPVGLVYEDEDSEIYRVVDNIYTGRLG